jgi:peroxiredoxin
MKSSLLRAILGLALLGGLSVGVSALTATSAVAGSAASDFALRDINGQTWQLSTLRGKVVVLSFWATWCGPCKEEMPHLQALQNELYEKGVVILSVSIDDARTASQVKPYIMSKGFNFPVLLDCESTAVVQYNPSKSVPYTVVIDRNFQVVDSHSGYSPGDETKLRALLLSLL